MADKELTVYIVDVGAAMAHESNGETDLEIGLQYVRNEFITKIIRERKTDIVSLVTVEDQVLDAELKGVSTKLELQMPEYRDMELLQRTPTSVEASQDTAGIIRALLYTFQKIALYVGKKKYIKNVVLITNSRSTPELDEAFLQGVRSVVVEQQIRMTLVGADFNESTDDQNRLTSMASWYSLFSGLPSSKVWHGGDVLNYLANPNPKLVRPVKVFQGEFRIGADLVDPEFDADIDQSCLCIPVEGYPGVKSARPPTRKNFGLNEQGKLVSISNLTEYHVRNYTKPEDNMDEVDNNDDTELAQRQFEIQLIDKSGLIKAYKYGSSTVVLPEELESQRVYQTIPGLDIIKVIPEKHLPRWYLLSETVLIMGQCNSVKEIRAFAAVVDSLKDLNAIAIGRYVQKKNAEVQIVALLPVYLHKQEERKRRADDTDRGDMRALALSRIPFMEDEKMASFPDLTNLTTTSGRVITGNHKLLPDEQVKATMDEFVEAMDLDQLGVVETDFDGDKRVFNQMTPDFSMKHHDVLVKRSVGNRRIDHMLKQIAINAITEGGLKKYCSKDDIIPLVPESLKADMEPGAQLVSKGEPFLEKLASLLQVTKVDKTKFTRRRKQLDEIMLEEDEDNISLEELLSRGVRN